MNKNMATILKTEQYNIVNIKWDTDGDEELFASLPQEIALPLQFASVAEDEDYLDEIGKKSPPFYDELLRKIIIQKN